MACIYKRGKTWSYSVDLGRDESGKRKKKGKGGFRTQKEAKEAAAILEAELANGIFMDEKKVTFYEFSNQWLLEHSSDIKPATFRLYEYAKNILCGYFANIKLKDITRMKYQKFLTVLFDKQYSTKTIKLIHTIANLILKSACKYDLLRENPISLVKIPKQKIQIPLSATETIPKYLEKDELKTFLLTVRNHRDNCNFYPIFLTLSYTGLRRGELVALKWSDIDFQNKTISISKNLYYGKGGIKNYILQSPKTKSSIRSIVVTDNVLQELQKLRNTQKKEQMLNRQCWHEENFIFTSHQYPGYPINPNLIWNIMKKMLKSSNLNTNLSPHSLRHTHTSLLAESGVSLEAIMERLGHSNDNITRSIYLHVTKKTKSEAAQKFHELMNTV